MLPKETPKTKSVYLDILYQYLDSLVYALSHLILILVLATKLPLHPSPVLFG